MFVPPLVIGGRNLGSLRVAPRVLFSFAILTLALALGRPVTKCTPATLVGSSPDGGGFSLAIFFCQKKVPDKQFSALELVQVFFCSFLLSPSVRGCLQNSQFFFAAFLFTCQSELLFFFVREKSGVCASHAAAAAVAVAAAAAVALVSVYMPPPLLLVQQQQNLTPQLSYTRLLACTAHLCSTRPTHRHF